MHDSEFQLPRFLRRSDAAKYLRDRWGLPCATRTLAKIACISSDGPEMHFAGRIPLYTPESLDEYALKKSGLPEGLPPIRAWTRHMNGPFSNKQVNDLHSGWEHAR